MLGRILIKSRHYGDGLYEKAAGILGIHYQDAAKFRRMAELFEIKERSLNLTFGHHYEVASVKRVVEAANRARSEAMQGVPYAAKGEERKPEKDIQQSVGGHTAPATKAKAAASKTNAGAVEKLFEAKVKPRTIEQRARRQVDATNVASDTTPQDDEESEENRREQDGTFRKGVSGNPAGRPPKYACCPFPEAEKPIQTLEVSCSLKSNPRTAC